MSTFETYSEQLDAKRLLAATLADGPVHGYLFHGPPGVGKRRAALAFAADLLGDAERVLRRAHPDLYVLEPLGDQIRIDAVRELRRDLHMRPFEANRRVYLLFGAEAMNDEAADALLKDLEEPPPYAVIVLVADDLGPVPETIRSRCQSVPFRRLSERAVREWIGERAPALGEEERTAVARVAGGRLDRAERLLDPAAAERRDVVIEVARGVYLEPAFEPADAAQAIVTSVGERGAAARATAEAELEPLQLPKREADQRARRIQRGAERDELLAELEELAAWYRDLVAVAAGAERTVIHFDRLPALREDGTRERMAGAERAAEHVRALWRDVAEFNLNPSLALEALFVRLRRELAGAVGAE